VSEEREAAGPTGNPLAGVLDRLLGRERGVAAAAPAPGRKAKDLARASEPEREPASRPRRMLAVAELGTPLGGAALRAAAQWAALLGRRPAATELSCGPAPQPSTEPSAAESEIAVVRVPCKLGRLQREPAEVLLALLDRLRRHELASDLCLVRIPLDQRRALLRAAFLGGALVVPVEEAERPFRQALELSRELVEGFHEVAIWPYARSPRILERFLAVASQELRSRATPFDPGRLDIGEALGGLREPPREGFLVGLLAPEPAELPPELLQADSIRL
jgi:hypothetical protein